MRVFCLNTAGGGYFRDLNSRNGGYAFESLSQLILQYRSSVDVFCFQELYTSNRKEYGTKYKIRLNLYDEICRLLGPDFQCISFNAPKYAKWYRDELLPSGVKPTLGMFIRNNFRIVNSGGFKTYTGGGDGVENMNFGALLTGNCQYSTITDGIEDINILNIHGLYQRGSNKVDTIERIRQTELLLEFTSKLKGKVIICGDFNLNIDTKSISMLSDKFTNLIVQNKITTTRSYLYKEGLPYADYVFVSPDIVPLSFRVLSDNVVSDHLAILFEF